MIAMPEAFHSATDDLPFADDWANTPGVRLKLLMADIEGARFAVRIRFAPGILLPPHKHTGEVHAFTLAGEWSYLEHPDIPPSRAGSLFEPPGSTHAKSSRPRARGNGRRIRSLRRDDPSRPARRGARDRGRREPSARLAGDRSGAREAPAGDVPDRRRDALSALLTPRALDLARRPRSARRSPTRRGKRESGSRRTTRGR